MTDEYSRQEKLPMRPTSRAGFYAAVYPSLAEVARAHGYALAIHGSLARDFDLVAIPWAEVAAEPLALIQALKEATGAVVHTKDHDHLFADLAVSQRPHGRLSYSLHFTDDGLWGPYLDISVVPRGGPQGATIAGLAEEIEDMSVGCAAGAERVIGLESEIARLREALEFYANDRTWLSILSGEVDDRSVVFIDDGPVWSLGKRAREALA